MKKIIVLLLIGTFCFCGVAFGANWSKYETGSGNIRLDGYQGQPGYIAFTDGNGTVLGYVWMDANGQVVFCTKAAIDLTTTKLVTSGSGFVGVLLK